MEKSYKDICKWFNIQIFKRVLAVFLCIVSLPIFGYELSILHTNDIHGRIVPIDYKGQNLGGWARRASKIKELKTTCKNTLLIDSGDLAQGSIYYQLFDGVPDVNFLDMTEYDAICIGNHELDKGIDSFENLTKLTNVPFLGANLEFKDNFYLNGKIRSHIIKNYDGFTVGIIGMTTPDLLDLRINKDKIALSNYDRTLQFFVDYLRNNVDLIVLLSHSGLARDIQTAKTIQGIDVIVGGHSHDLLEEPLVVNNCNRKVLIVQAGEFGTKLGKLDIEFDKTGIKSFKGALIPLDATIENDSKIQKKINEIHKDVEILKTQKIATTKVKIDLTTKNLRMGLVNSGAMILDALKRVSPDSDIAIMNSGSIRGNKIIPKGIITKYEIMEILPFNNKIAETEMTGFGIKSLLERAVQDMSVQNPYSRNFLQTKGLSYTIELSEESLKYDAGSKKLLKEGNRIKNITINNKPIEMGKKYKVITNEFLAGGGDGFFQFKDENMTKNTIIKDYTVTNAVCDYLKNAKKIAPCVTDTVSLSKPLKEPTLE